MSWWVYLQDRTAPPWCSYGTPTPDACQEPCYPVAVPVARHAEGGTYALGGTEEAELNVTYNYSRYFYEALGDGFRESLDGKRARDVEAVLERGLATLGTDQADDYWASTPGNAGRVLMRLLLWAREHPDAVFRVS